MTSHDVFFSVFTSSQGIAWKWTAVLWIVHLEMSTGSLQAPMLKIGTACT